MCCNNVTLSLHCNGTGRGRYHPSNLLKMVSNGLIQFHKGLFEAEVLLEACEDMTAIDADTIKELVAATQSKHAKRWFRRNRKLTQARVTLGGISMLFPLRKVKVDDVFDDQDIKSSIHSLAVIVATTTVVNGAFREVASGQTRADV